MIDYHLDEHNIVTLTFDRPDRRVNLLDAAFGQALHDALEQVAAEPEAAGIILISAKKSFIAGADLAWMRDVTDPQRVFDSAEQIKAVFRRMETLGIPVVAALNGTALGGGFEVALACHRRIAVDDAGARFGFPEVSLGLIPGAGGITRLTRMLGLQEGLPYLLEGTRFDPRRGVAIGLIDEVAANREELLHKARHWIQSGPDPRRPWDRGERIPGGDPRSPKVAQMLAIAPAMLRQETRGNYPAPEAILSAAAEGALVDFDTATRIESRYLAQVATGPVARNMITAFWSQLNEIEAGRSRPDDVPPQKTERVGVLGAGMMGHGIAYVSAYTGMEVVLKDVTGEKAEAGRKKIAGLLEKRVQRGKLSQERADEILARVHATADPGNLSGCDLIIEAVFEDRELKATVTAETEAVIDDDTIFGSNTSTLPISGLAQASERPGSFVGIHFFSPVHKMKLVEIIVGEQTSDRALAKAFDYTLAINKTPIVVNDSRGFYTSRVFATYVTEGHRLLAEGQHPRAIEMAGTQAGMPVGPLAVSDEINLGLIRHIRSQTEKDMVAEGRPFQRTPADDVVDAMLKERRQGRAQGGGFYAYPAGEEKHLWPGLAELFPVGDIQLSQELMMDRLLFVQALETVRCLEEGVLNSVADANLGSIFGWGFPPFHGGTLQFVNSYGVERFVERARELERAYGRRFAPPAMVVEMAEKGTRFE